MEPEDGVNRPKRMLDEIGGGTPPSRESEAKRLTGHYPKPLEGERIPISILGTEKRRIGWSPEVGKSVQIDDETAIEPLKRVREINEVQIFNWLTGREGLIELPDPVMKDLQSLLEAKNGEQLVYSREKVKGKLKPRFDLEEEREPRRWLLSDRL